MRRRQGCAARRISGPARPQNQVPWYSGCAIYSTALQAGSLNMHARTSAAADLQLGACRDSAGHVAERPMVIDTRSKAERDLLGKKDARVAGRPKKK